MRAVDIIQKKQFGHELSSTEIDFFFTGYQRGEIPDYQVSALLMAIYFNGFSFPELHTLTRIMVNSGQQITFPRKKGFKKFLIDKHSTGGVGDKTTLALMPILAAFDLATVKLTGQGLGHTGGTTDKLESIPGFTFPDNADGLRDWVSHTGIGVMSYSDQVVPLDKKLYTLRDVTSTVASIPLIAASIMSKKLAVASQVILLDVKVGKGAFMKNVKEARLLAETMLAIGKGFRRRVVAVLTAMDQPLGYAVGNSLEVIEAIDTLKGRGPRDFTELIHTLVAVALKQRGDIVSLSQGMKTVEAMIASEKPLEKLRSFITHGGGKDIVEDISFLPLADQVRKWKSPQSGVIAGWDAEKVGTAAMILGAGRTTKEEKIDPSVGIRLKKKVGDIVTKGEPLAEIYYRDPVRLSSSFKLLKESLILHSSQSGSPKPVKTDRGGTRKAKEKVIIDIME